MKDCSKKQILILSFAIPVFILICLFLIFGITPFGDNTLLYVDAGGQYISYFEYYRNVIENHQNFFYTFEKTLGGSAIGLFAYYLVSPFNFIFLLFPADMLPTAFSLVVLIKIGLCGLCCAIFFLNDFSLSLNRILLFSTSYALSGYAICYCWSVMWLDSVFLLPIVALGIKRICFGKSALLYTVSLSLSIIMSFYIGYMICIFSLFYFAYLLYISPVAQLKPVISRWALGSVLSGGLSAFILLPALLSMQGGKRRHMMEIVLEHWGRILENFSIDEGKSILLLIIVSVIIILGIAFFLFLMISHKIPAQFKKNLVIFILLVFIILMFIKENRILLKAVFGGGEFWEVFSGDPNIYAGIFVFMLVVEYFLNSKIPVRVRSAGFVFVMVFLLSFIFYVLSLVWHGFTANIAFNSRFSFIFIFFIITLAAAELDYEAPSGIVNYISPALVIVLISMIALIKKPVFIPKWQPFLAIILAVLFTIIRNRSPKMLFTLHFLSLAITAGITIQMFSVSSPSVSGFSETYRNVREQIAPIEENNPEFYRLRYINLDFNRNDPMTFGYRGLKHYSSTEKTDLIKFVGYLGSDNFDNISSSADKEFYPEGSDSLFSVKYILNGTNITYNPYTLPIGFISSDDAICEFEFSADPYDNIERIFQLLSGEKDYIAAFPILTEQPCSTEVIHDSHLITKTTVGKDGQCITYSIPYENGWHAFEDGNKLLIEKAVGNLLAIRLESGIHTIELKFVPPGIYAGIAISLTAFAILIFTKKKGLL